MITTNIFISKTFITSNGSYVTLPEINPNYSHFNKFLNIVSFSVFSLIFYQIRQTKALIFLNVITFLILLGLVINNYVAIMLICNL